MPFIAHAGQPAADLVGEALAKPTPSLAHGLVAHVDAARGQKFIHHAKAQRKTEVEPHGVADDLTWKAVAGVGGLGRRWTSPCGVEGSVRNLSTPGGWYGTEASPEAVHPRV